MATILVVDDELGIRALLSEILSDEGHTIELAENAAQARSARERMRPDLVLLDIWMPDVDGVTLLKEWGGAGLLTMPVIMMSGHGTIDTAVEATKFGAIAFLEKPITLQKLLRAVEQALVKTAPPRPAPAAMGQPSYARAELPPSLSLGGLPATTPGQIGGTLPGHLAGNASNSHTLLSEQSFELDRPLREARDAFEKSYFEFHLAKENGSMTRVAEKTGLERTHLYRKLKQLGVDLSRNKRGAGG
ncbi:response regulator [Roseateles sp. BYS96W]|uniref:Response regulator n=1 Tax=Pelomonas nitida TaxID=3299027 RepID=A0ABW7G6D6_9BURK